MLQQKSIAIRYLSAYHISMSDFIIFVIIFISIITTNSLNAQPAEQISGNKLAAKKLYDDGRYKTRSNSEDISHYTKILQLDPEFRDAHLELGFARFKMKNSSDSPNYEQISRDNCEKALQDFTRAAELTTSSYDLEKVYYGQGIALICLGKHKKAIEFFNKITKLRDRSFYLYEIEQRGFAFQAMGDIQSAVADYMTSAAYNAESGEENYSRVIKLKPNFAEAYYQRGLIFLKKGYADDRNRHDEPVEKDQAIEFFKRAVSDFNDATRLKPDFFDAYFKRGLARVALGETPQAEVEEANKVFQINPDMAQAYHVRGTAFYKMGKREEAIEDFTKAISYGQIDQELAEIYFQRGVAYKGLNLYRKAEEDFERAKKEMKGIDGVVKVSTGSYGIRVSPEGEGYSKDNYNENKYNLYRETLFHFADSMIKLNRHSEALHALNLLIEKIGVASDTNNGSVFSHEFKIDKLKFNGIERKSYEAHLLRGKILAAQGKQLEAEKENEDLFRYYMYLHKFEEARKIMPSNPVNYIITGYLYYKKKDYRNALRIYSDGVKLNPDNITLHIGLSEVNRVLGNKKNLIKDYTNIIRINNSLFQFYKMRSLLYKEAGDDKRAAEDYSVYLDKCIEHNEVENHKSYWVDPSWFYTAYYNDNCSNCSISLPYTQDAEFQLAEIYYEKGLQVAKSEKEKAAPLFQNALDIFTKLGNEEWQQKVKIALDSTK